MYNVFFMCLFVQWCFNCNSKLCSQVTNMKLLSQFTKFFEMYICKKRWEEAKYLVKIITHSYSQIKLTFKPIFILYLASVFWPSSCHASQIWTSAEDQFLSIHILFWRETSEGISPFEAWTPSCGEKSKG